MEPLKLYWRPLVPNPMKVVIILEELRLPYVGQYLELQDLYRLPFQPTLNPNGKVPALHDPNTGLTLWESGAIVTYLIETYDKDHKISFVDREQKYTALCWQHLQATGQGPYFGQAAWFNMFHEEKLESAQARYAKELQRILGVLDKQLEGKEWLVGNKCSYVDLSFVPWSSSIPIFMEKRPKEEWDTAKFKNFTAWLERVTARESVKKATNMKEEKDVVGRDGSTH